MAGDESIVGPLPFMGTPNPPVFPFPNAIEPEKPPFKTIPVSPHMSTEIWQTSYYDATNSADMGVYKQLSDGPCDLKTGRLIDGEFGGAGPFKQV
jgi:hypothetical protein